MNKKLVLLVMIFIFLLTSMPSVNFEIKEVKGAETVYIYIRNDGSIETSPVSVTSNITSLDNITYTFTDNNYAFLVIEKGNIVVDGSGFALQGTGWGKGLTWSAVSNVTISNMEIKGFSWGVEVYNSSNNLFYQTDVTNNNNCGFYITKSPNSTISKSTVSNNGGYSYTGQSSIYISSSSNFTIRMNNVTNNPALEGIKLSGSSGCYVYENNITGNYFGIRLFSSDNSYLHGNKIATSGYEGVALHDSSNNTLYNNSLDNNRYGIHVEGYEFGHYLNNINSSNFVNGKPVYYMRNQHNLTINRSTHPEIGYLALINSTDVHVESHNFTGNAQGLLLAYTNDSEISSSRFTNNYNGLMLFNSFNNSICGNEMSANDYRGAYLWNSNGNSIFQNEIISNKDQGLYLSDSSNNKIYRNTFAHSEYAIELDGTNNSLYHNNFINNTQQIDSYNLVNFWNNSIEGNYWSNYNGTDSDLDGIGDIPYQIDSNNIDHYPLMGMFSSFDTTLGKHVNVVTNSTIENFEYFEHNSTIIMHVSNMTANQTHGFCRTSIPYEVMSEPFNVTINGVNPTYWNYTLCDNGTHRWIYFVYGHSTLEIIIVPEVPSFLILPLFAIATLLAVIVYRRKHSR